MGVLVVERRDRRTRLGDGSSAPLLDHAGRRVEAVCPPASGAGLGDDCVAVITSRAARIDGDRRGSPGDAMPSDAPPRCTRVSRSAVSERTTWKTHEHDAARRQDGA